MLKWRVVTALVLAPPVFALVWYAPTPWLALAFGIVILLAAAEWAALVPLRSPGGRAAYVAAHLAVLVLAWLALGQGESQATALLVPGAAWWAAAVAWLVLYARAPGARRPASAIGAVVGFLVLSPAWVALVFLHQQAPYGGFWVTLLLLLVWGSDVGGYFAGRAFGRRKLAPAISPGKTWAGVAGGLALGLAAALALQQAALRLGVAPPLPAGLLAVFVLTIGFGVAGDLFESMMKRQRGVKDSGSLLPGHGGVLDRVDALVAGAPVLALGVSLVH